MRQRVLITCPQLQATFEQYRLIFKERNIDVELPKVEQQLGELELLEIIEHFDGVIAGDDQFTAKVLEKAKRLKVIARWGVGIDGIDLETAKRRGISVSNTPNVFNDEVADIVMGYIIMMARQLHILDRSIREGGWPKIQGVSLSGKTLGVIGTGNIGQAVSRRAVVAGISVMGHDVAPPPPSIIEELGINFTSLDQLLAASDFISLNCNLTEANWHLLGPREFALMKPGVYIINAARGPLIHEPTLVQALQDGKVAGAALDVFENEPLPPNSPLRQFDNCIFGTHNASNTLEAVMRVNERAINNLLEALECVNH
jgi:D-3-phosphoglycerate dehydrogenase